MRKFRHPALALFVLATLSPTVALGQAEKVGIVTTLEGNVTTKRAVLPLPVPLKFKDDVFFRDTITTSDQSLARVLLGGKSIVTVRERSVVTITESPGRSFINLESGKIGLAVARERLAPGESVDIRTPNAVVGVRGTVVVAEVLPAAAAAVTSNVYFLRGSGECSVLDQRTGRPIGGPVTLKPLESFKVVGSTARVDPISASQVGQITAGLESKGIQHKEAANQEQVKGQVTEATSAVLGALTGGAVVEVPVVQVASQLVVKSEVVINPTPGCGAPDTPSCKAAPPPPTVPSNITIDPALAMFTAAMAAAPTAVVTIPAGVAALTIPGSAFEVETTTPVPANLDRPLFQATGANLTIGGNLLNVLGSLSSTSSLPVLSTDPTTITTGGDFIRIAPGASMSVNGSLLSDTGGALTAGGSFISVEGGGSLTSTGASPMVQLNNTNVTVAGDLFHIGSDPSTSRANVNISGPLVKLTNGTTVHIGSANVITNGGFENGFTGWTIFDLGDGNFGIQSGTTSPLSGFSLPAPPAGTRAAMSDQSGPGLHILYRDVTVPRNSPVLQFALFIGNRATFFASPNTLDFSGVPNQQVRVDLIDPAAGIQNLGTAVLRNLFQTQPGQPLVSGYRLFSVDLSDFAGQTVRLRFTEVDNQFFFQLGVDDVRLPSIGSLLRVDKSSVTNTSADPLVVASQALVTTTGDLVALARGAALTTSGSLMSATASSIVPATGTVLSLSGGSTLTAGSVLDLSGTNLDLGPTGTVLSLTGGSRFTMTRGPFATLSGGSLMAGTLIRADDAGRIVNLMGGLLDLSNKAIVTLGRIANSTDIFTQALGVNESVITMSSSTLKLTGEGPLVKFGVDAGNPIEQGGVALIATGTVLARSVIDVNGSVLDLGGVKLMDPNPQVQLSQTTVNQTGPNSLIEVFGLPVTASGPLLNARAGSTIEVKRGSLLDVNGPFTVNGPGIGALLQFADSTVRTGFELVFVAFNGRLTLERGLIDAVNTSFFTSTFDTFFTLALGGSVTASTANPFIRLNSSPLTMLPGEDFIGVGIADGNGRASLTLKGGGPLVTLEVMDLSLGSGRLLRVRGSDVSVGGPLLDMVDANLSLTGPVLKTESRSTITTTAGPAIRISGGSLIADVLAGTDGLGNRLNLTGPVLDLTNTNVTLRRVGDEPTGSTDTFALMLARNTPVIRMVGSTLTTTGVDADLVDVGGGVATQGTALTATGSSTVGVKGSLLRLADITSRATNPLVQLADSAVNQTVTARPLIGVDGTTNLTGQLLAASDSTIKTSGAFAQFRNGTLNSSTTNPLLAFQGGGVKSAGNMVLVDGLNMNLRGSLLSFTGSDVIASNNLVRLVNGAQVLGSPPNPLVVFDDVIYQGGTAFNTASGGSLLRMFSSTGQPGTKLSLTGGPYFSAINASDVTSKDAPLFNIADGATITSTTTQPFASFKGIAPIVVGMAPIVGNVTTAGTFFNLDMNTSFTVPGQPPTVGNGTPATMSINGVLIEGFDVKFTTSNNSPFLRLHNGITLTQSGNQPLVLFNGSSARTTTAILAGDFLSMFSDSGRSAPNLIVADGLLDARDTFIQTGNRLTNTNPFAFIGDGSQVTLSHDKPFISLDNSALSTAGNVVTLRRSRSGVPSRMILNGPLFIATNGSRVDTSSLGFGAAFGVSNSACCAGFFIGQGAQLAGTSTQDLIRLVNSTFNSGPDAFSGGNFFHVTDTGPTPTEVVAPSTVTIAGRLLSAQSSTVTALFSLLGVTRSSFTSTTTNPLIEAVSSTLAFGGPDPTQPGNPTTFGRILNVAASSVANTASDPATVVLSGPLALLTGSSLTTTADLVGVLNGGSVSSTTGAALIQLVNSIVTTGSSTPAIFGRALFMTGQGGSGGTAFATLSLGGPFWSSVNGTLTLRGGLVGIFAGARVIASGSGAAFASITGGTHSIGTLAGSSIFFMQGRSTATTVEVADAIAITRGTDEPIQTARTLLATSGATVNSQAGGSFDTMLFQATAPIFSASAGSSLAFANDAVLFSKNVKMTAPGPLVALNASTLTSTNGAILNLNTNALLQVTGDLFSLSNASMLRTLNGPLIRVANNSVLNVGGALAAFLGTGGNVINIANSLCASFSCSTFAGGITVAFSGTPSGNVSIGPNPFKNPSLGSLMKSANAAVIFIQGNSKVTIAAP